MVITIILLFLSFFSTAFSMEENGLLSLADELCSSAFMESFNYKFFGAHGTFNV